MKKLIPRIGTEVIDLLAQLDDEAKKKKVLMKKFVILI